MSEANQYHVTILGCGSSGGVPRVNGDWGNCDPNEPKSRRTRCSILIQAWTGEKGSQLPDEAERTIILIDTSPDLRSQLIPTGIQHIDALLYTHEHADQSHGIDDVRAIAYTQRERIKTYIDEYNYQHVAKRFLYCFEKPEGRDHPPILDLQPFLESEKSITIEGAGGTVKVMPVGLSHGPSPVLGFRIGPLAYAPDVHDLGEAGLHQFEGIDTFIVDALRYHDHPTHAHADKTLSWGAKLRARSLVLTNLHIDMDYAQLKSELPTIAEPAFDGMQLRLSV